MGTTVNEADAGSNYHPIFSKDHDDLRNFIRSFVLKEIAPHADEWELQTFPSSIFRRMGELGLLGLDKAERLGGQGATI